MDVTREVRRASRVPIIMPTAHVEELNKVLGPELGADDYVVKPFGARQLVARVRAVFRRLDEVAWAAAQGTVTVKTAPPSARFAAATVSPWAATIARAMARAATTRVGRLDESLEDLVRISWADPQRVARDDNGSASVAVTAGAR